MKRMLSTIVSFFRSLLPTNNYLHRLIWLGCISVTLPIILAGSAYYHFSMKKLTAQFQADNQASLQMLVDRVENILTNIEHESLQISQSTMLRNALGSSVYPTDYLGQLNILEFFQLHKNTNNLVHDIIFYDDRSGTALSHYYGLTGGSSLYGDQDIQFAMELDSYAGWFYLPESGKSGYISYVRHLPIMSMDLPQGVLIIQVREQLLMNLLRTYRVSLQGQSLAILDSNNRMLIDSEGGSMAGERVRTDPALQAVLNDGSSTNRFVVDGEEEQLVAFFKTSQGRTYVSQLPKREMIEQLSWIRVLLLLSVSIFVLIGILLSLFASRMAYNPIQKLTQYGKHLRKSGSEDVSKQNEIEYIRSCLSYLNDQTESLNRYVSNIQPALRDRCLQQLLKPGGLKDRQLLEEECAKHNIPQDGQFVVLVTKVENLLKEKRFLPNEGPIIVFAVKNVMTELLDQLSGIEGFVIDKDDRESVAIFRFRPEATQQEIRQMLTKYGEDVRNALDQYLSFSVSTGIGSPVLLEQLPDSYKEAQSALKHRLFHVGETVLFYEDMIQAERQPVFMYPREIEENMVEFLWSGDLPQAEEALHQFSGRVRTSESYNIIFQCYQVLLSAIIQSLEEKGPGVSEMLGDNLFDQLKESQTAQEVHDWFIGILFPLYQQVVDEIRNHSSKLMIQRVCSFIANDPGAAHSLSECAEMVQVSPSYLSRLFKREVGSSFIEYLMKAKVEKAKGLLKDTEFSIADIAERVGYSERNLNRAFQRFVEMSPKQYRMSIR